MIAIQAPISGALNRAAVLLLLAAACLAALATIAGPATPANLCGAHLAAAHEHCWRCYALAAAALGFTAAAFRQIVRFARPSTTLAQG